MELKQAVSLRIRELLKERSYTQRYLATRSGIPASTLSTIIKCKTPSRTDVTILNICRGLDIDIFEFYNTPMFKLENIEDN